MAMALEEILLSLALSVAPLCAVAGCLPAHSPQQGTAFQKADLGAQFLLQTSYEQENGRQDFMTSRSRIVSFERDGRVLRMIEAPRDEASASHRLAAIPIVGETSCDLRVDYNVGLDRIYKEEDRTGEDYYGRLERHDYSFFRLVHRRMLDVSRIGSMLVLDQMALSKDGEPVLVHYYLSPYRPNPKFLPFETKNLDHFGFYETYPRIVAGRTVLYAMKFDSHGPIVFALSSNVPERYRQAVRDGVLYWNKALGVPLLHVIDAPEGVAAPSPRYNVIQWVMDGDYASTSHIQSDPLTGEILHADIFILSHTVDEGDPEQQKDHLRYVVAHEVGHALGLRHNFAQGPPSTVMNYFRFDHSVEIGRDFIESGSRGLEYDRRVMRGVYLGKPLDLDTLPPFCTDGQVGCGPFEDLTPTLAGATN